MKKINIYGAPGSDRHTLAALLYLELKKRNLSVELVRDYDEKLGCSGTDKESLFYNLLDYLIADEPIIISKFYNPDQEAVDFNLQPEEHHYFLERSQNFKPRKKNLNDKRNDEIEKNMQDFLTQEQIAFIKVKGEERAKLEFILKCEGVL